MYAYYRHITRMEYVADTCIRVQMSFTSCHGFLNELLPIEGTKKYQSESHCLPIPHHATTNCLTYFPTKLFKILMNTLSVILPLLKNVNS